MLAGLAVLPAAAGGGLFAKLGNTRQGCRPGGRCGRRVSFGAIFGAGFVRTKPARTWPSEAFCVPVCAVTHAQTGRVDAERRVDPALPDRRSPPSAVEDSAYRRNRCPPYPAEWCRCDGGAPGLWYFESYSAVGVRGNLGGRPPIPR